MKELKNELNWSVSRENTLDFCERQYYYQYYLSWGGWEKSAEKRRRVAYLLKNRINIRTWVGDKTHIAIRIFLLSTTSDADVSGEIKSSIKSSMIQEFEKSKQKVYLKTERYKDFGLIEHYMDQDITEIDLNNTIQEVISNFESFLKGKHCNSVLEAINNGKRYGIDEENFDKMRFNIEQIPGTSIFSNPDIYYETAKNEIFILDWKTGKENEKKGSISLQLKVCGLKLLTEENITPTTFKIKAYNVYLPSNKEIGGVLTERHTKSAITSISKGIKKMQKHLIDVKNNVPEPEEAFIRTKSINKCAVCNYREICEERTLFD